MGLTPHTTHMVIAAEACEDNMHRTDVGVNQVSTVSRCFHRADADG